MARTVPPPAWADDVWTALAAKTRFHLTGHTQLHLNVPPELLTRLARTTRLTKDALGTGWSRNAIILNLIVRGLGQWECEMREERDAQWERHAERVRSTPLPARLRRILDEEDAEEGGEDQDV